MQILSVQTSSAGDERSSRDPKVHARAYKQHVANAVEWLRRADAFNSATAPEGCEYDALVKAHRRECQLANINPLL